jgi:Domain of unknown function (DUF4386)
MTDLDSLRRLAIYSTVLAIVLSVPSSLAFFAAFGGDVEAAIFGHPTAILGGGASAAALLRWGAILDMFYSYLLLVPLAVFLHRRLRPVKPWLADIGTIAALAYIFVGAAGAAILATVGSSLVEAYAAAAPADQPAIATSFDVLRNIVYFGLWQTLDPITSGVWISSVGWLLLSERRLIGRFLVVLGAGLMGMSVMTMLGIHSLAALLASVAVIMLIWLGWVVGGRPSRR